MTDAADTAAPGRGRTRITARALDQIVSAVTSDELGVSPRRVGVELRDDAGSLTLVLRSPLRVASLRRVIDDPDSVVRTGGSLLERAAAAQANIRSRVQHLTGSDVSRISLRVTDVDTTAHRRVR